MPKKKAMPIALLTATVLKSGHFQMITTIICYSAADLYRAVGGLVQQLALQGDPEAEKEGMKTYHLEKLWLTYISFLEKRFSQKSFLGIGTPLKSSGTL